MACNLSPHPDGANKGGGAPAAPCKFEKGLRSKFPHYKFNVSGGRGWGWG